MHRAVATAALFSLGLFSCSAPELTIDLYSDPVHVDLGSLPVDGGVMTFEVVIANTGTGDGEITSLDLSGDDLTYVSLEPVVSLPLAIAANDVARIPVTVTNLADLPDGWFEQVLTLDVVLDSTWGSGGCNGGAAASPASLSVPITFAVPTGCDADDDGFRSLLCGGDDCDDTLATVHPGADEVCDFEDNDCDGTVDGPAAIGALDWYADTDGDGYGAGTGTSSCVSPGLGFVNSSTDCGPGDAAVNPDADEICNTIDDDCDGDIDDADPSVDTSTGTQFWSDRDGDEWGDANDSVFACAKPIGRADQPGDCDELRAFINPGASEECDGQFDEDCDNEIDESDAIGTTPFYADRDGDGHGDPSSPMLACDAPTGHVANQTDCDDTSPLVYTGAPELCNNRSDDCDAAVDEGAGDTYYADRDADGWGDDADSKLSCTTLVGHVLDGGDCDDLDGDFHPEAPDSCDDGVDYNCDGAIEDGCHFSCLDVLQSGQSTGDGLYSLDVDTTGDGTPDFEANTWCDMTTDGGGWSLAQRTVWDWSDSSQLQTDFADWSAQPIGSAAPGAAYRLPGYVWENIAAQGDLLAVHRVRTEAGGACSPLYYEGTGGTLTVDLGGVVSLTGLTSDVVLAANSLSTTDTGPFQACVNNFDAVGWFYGGCCSNCPTFGGAYWTDEPHPMANYVTTTADLFGQTTDDVCTSSPQTDARAGTFAGVDSMEFYFR